jgi:mycothiol S-conjugate amidase
MPSEQSQPPCLLTVHAHPDDEASKGAGTVARYNASGVRTVLVTCTGGEAGDVLNPAMNTPEVVADLPAVRLRELTRAAEIIGYDEVVLLGYRDSGMPDSPANADPRAFANAPLDETVGALVEVIRRERPQVIITYPDDQSGYPHPDHLRVHDISVLAFDRAGDPDWYPEAGEPFQPLKLYYSTWSRRRLVAVHEGLLAHRGESPFDEKWFERPDTDHRVTTQLDVGDFMWARTGALRAHATQVDPTAAFWFGLSDEELKAIYPWEDWILARSLVGPIPSPADGDDLERDLFAGIQIEVTS